MLKLVFLALSLAVAANAAGLGSWEDATVGEVSELARWSTQQMTTMAGLEGDYTIQTPRNVRKQVVNGINYKFTLDVIVRDADNKYTFKSCEIAINDNPSTQTRVFLSAPVCTKNPISRIAGGWTPVNAITDEIMNVARISAKQMNTQLGSAGEWNVNKVYNVQRQIVNGVNYKYTVEYLFSAQNKYTFKVCDMTVNYRPWAGEQQVSFVDAPVCRDTVKRELAGGWTQQNAVTDDVMELARWSASQLSAYTGIKGDHTVMTARNVQTQVVAGISYKFTLDLVINNSATGKYTFQSCDLNIFTQSWTNTRQIVSAKCGPNPNMQ